MKKVVIGIVVFCILGSAVGAATYVWYVLPHQKAAAEALNAVIVPEHFARYTADIQRADKIITQQRAAFRDGSLVTLQDLQGFFSLPLKQTIRPQQIRPPGDPREYRKGIHQGIDFYETKRGDPVYPAAPGIIIRIDLEYQPLPRKFRDELLKKCETTWNGTPGSVGLPPVEEPYGNVLDKLSGRQVLVYHGQNAQHEPLISLYAHLLDVNPELSVDAVVMPDTVIGYIGNSGTSGEVENNPKKENHLHLELFVGGMYWTPKTEAELGKKQSGARYAELQKLVLQTLAPTNPSPSQTQQNGSSAASTKKAGKSPSR